MNPTAVPTTADEADEARRILDRESRLRLQLKRLRAKHYLRLVGEGVKGPTAWQEISLLPEVQKVEDEWEMAKNARTVTTAVVFGVLPETASESEAA